MSPRKLICFLVFVFFVSTLFISGCELPAMADVFKKTPETAPGRGIDVDLLFNREKTIRSIEVGEELGIGLYIINHGVNEFDVDIFIRDDLPEEYGAIEDRDSKFIYSGAEKEDSEIKSVKSITNEKPILFGPYIYNKRIKGVKIFVELEVDDYEVGTYFNEQLPSVCVRKSGVYCKSKLSQNDLGWSIRTAPISISNIEEEQVSLNEEEDEIKVSLIITFKNYGGEINNEDKQIEDFDIKMEKSGLNCEPYEEKEFLSFKKKNEVKIKCTTIVNIGKADSIPYPLEISFSYPYKITKSFGPIDVV